MTIAEREKKLKYAEKKLKATRTRIKRLFTLMNRWEDAVQYQSRQLAYERAIVHSSGRMFRG